jgi:Fe2+ transport system protein B
MSEIENSNPELNSEPSLSINDGSSTDENIREPITIEEVEERLNNEKSVEKSEKIFSLNKSVSEKQKTVTIEDASKEIQSITPSKKSIIVSSEERKTYRTRVAGELAQKFWGLLAFVVGLHLLSIIVFSFFLVKNSASSEKYSEAMKNAVSNVNEASKTLYTFLGPLATAVTGYYFSSIAENNSKDD